jgi:hypothetical protein
MVGAVSDSGAKGATDQVRKGALANLAVARRKNSVEQKMDENQVAVFRTYGNSF